MWDGLWPDFVLNKVFYKNSNNLRHGLLFSFLACHFIKSKQWKYKPVVYLVYSVYLVYFLVGTWILGVIIESKLSKPHFFQKSFKIKKYISNVRFMPYTWWGTFDEITQDLKLITSLPLLRLLLVLFFFSFALMPSLSLL